MKIFRNKKGNIEDVLVGGKHILMLFLFVVLGLIILEQYNSKIQTDDNFIMPGNESRAAVEKFNTRLPIVWDWGIFFLYIGFIIFSCISARFIPTNSIYMIGVIIFLPLMVFISMIMANFYDKMLSQSNTIALKAAEMPFTGFLLDNLVYASLFYVVIVGIVLYSRKDAN